MNIRKLLVGAAFLSLAAFFAIGNAEAATVYNFESDTLNQVPASTTVTAGTFEVSGNVSPGKSLRALTKTGAVAAIRFDAFASTTDYSITWKQAYTAGGGRSGFLLRAQSVDGTDPGVRQGYLFQVNATSSPSFPNTLRIYSVTGASTNTLIGATVISSTPRWYKAVTIGNSLEFYYSDDGVNYTLAVSTTSSLFPSGGVQYVTGYSSNAVSQDYVDDITQEIAPVVIAPGAISVASTTATFAWTTGIAADGQIEYGLTSTYTASSTLDSTSTTSRRVSLSGLQPNTTYHYRLVSTSQAGTVGTTGDSTFTTLATTSIRYDFNLDTVGQTPSNTTVGAGTFEVSTGATALGTSLRTTTSSIVGITFNNFASTSDYSVTWKAAYTAATGRDGMVLRSQSGASAYAANVRQGYLFQVNSSGSAAPNTLRIYSLTGSSNDTLVSANLTSASPRWYKASAVGNVLTFEYSNDGTNFVTAATTTSSVFSSGNVQYAVSTTGGVNYVDDVTQDRIVVPDTFAPLISAIASSTASTSASISWTTNEPATTQVEYGLTSTYTASSTLDTATTTSHAVALSGLTPNTLYHFRLFSRDAAGNLATSSDMTFTTLSSTSTGSIALTSPKAYQVFQRNGSSIGSISITGTYTGAPSSIEASWNGGAYQTIVASPVGGTFTGSLSGMNAGQGTLNVRFADTPSASTSVAYVGIGDIFMVTGQSNASGRGFTNQAYTHSTLKAALFGNDDVWKELIDPMDSSSGQIDSVSADSANGSVWPLVATLYMADQGVPVAFIPAAKGGVSVTSWQRSFATSTLYGSMYRRFVAAGSSVKGVLYFQGETDAQSNMARSTYLSNINAFSNAILGDLGVRPIVGQIGNSSYATTSIDAIRLAQIDSWNAGVSLIGPAFPDVNLSDEGGDNLHFRSNADLQVFANRWWASIRKNILNGVDGRGPRLSSANWGDDQSQVIVTFTDDTLPLLPSASIGGFSVKDGLGNAIGVSSASRIANDKIKIMLASTVSGTGTISLASGANGIGANMPTDSSTYNLPAEIFIDQVIGAAVPADPEPTPSTPATSAAPGSITAVSAPVLSASEISRIFGQSSAGNPAVTACGPGALFNVITGQRCPSSTGIGIIPANAVSLSQNLSFGVTNSQVKVLQRFLNGRGFFVASQGSGSPGNETEYFGSATRAALAKFQKANGISPAAGYFGPVTRAFIEK